MIHLIGAGGHASVVADVARRLGAEELTLWSETQPEAGRFPSTARWRSLDELSAATPVILAIGDLGRRAELRRRFPVAADALVDPSAILGSGVRIGKGTVIMAGCIVSANAVVAEDAILNTACIVEHDCVVGRNTHVAPAVSLGGGARVGADALVGTGAIVLPGVALGDRATVGAGAVVHENVAEGAIVVGIPARAIGS